MSSHASKIEHKTLLDTAKIEYVIGESSAQKIQGLINQHKTREDRCVVMRGVQSSNNPLGSVAGVRSHKGTSNVFSPKYRANKLLRIRFSADVITNTSSKIHLYTVLAMHFLGMCPNMAYV